MNHDAIAKQLGDWQLLPRPERLSELYFTNERQLPTTAKQGAAQKVAFVVHNIEHQTVVYHYALFAVSGTDRASQSLGDGTLTLNHDQSETVNEMVKIPSISKRTAIKVELEYDGVTPGTRTPGLQKQSIAYWVGEL